MGINVNERDITFAEAWSLGVDTQFIDLRTPAEFKEGTIPGAVNVPIFTNEEREEVGTIYHQASPAAARRKALEIVSPKIPELVARIEQASMNQVPILFCWRGGMRSKGLSSILEMMKMPYYRLRDGYKGFRKYIREYLDNYRLTGPLVVLHGYTGVGKTEILQRLQAWGHPVIDLEGLAGHRGSAFGAIGLGEPPGQKIFDVSLWQELEHHRGAPYLLIEAESRRIGKVVIPDFLIDERENGINLLLEAPMAKRVANLLQEYRQEHGKEEFKAACLAALNRIQKRLVRKAGRKGLEEARRAVEEARWRFVTAFLLENYYDPLYQHSHEQYADFAEVVDASDIEAAARKIAGILADRFGSAS
ncbi:MAG: tRNA 2-selenouridine(34) synthase MnmH [Halanaerobium sp.]|nr:tRNA 2-selenouridine(34) synthase MnmH [Halanaerobium sp.]